MGNSTGQQESRSKAETLNLLRKEIQHLEGFKAESCRFDVQTKIEAIDRCFPEGVFPLGVVHELICQEKSHVAPTLGFLSALMTTVNLSRAPVLWITQNKDVFAPGLITFGLEPHRIVFMSVQSDREALWAMEEGLHTKGLAAAISEVTSIDLTATKRLQLATESSGVTGFLIRFNKQGHNSSCFSSWAISGLPSQLEDGLPGVGFPRWHVELRKIRNGRLGEWDIEWRAGEFRLVDKVEDKAVFKPVAVRA